MDKVDFELVPEDWEHDVRNGKIEYLLSRVFTGEQVNTDAKSHSLQAARLRKWLKNRPENEIVLVTHGDVSVPILHVSTQSSY